MQLDIFQRIEKCLLKVLLSRQFICGRIPRIKIVDEANNTMLFFISGVSEGIFFVSLKFPGIYNYVWFQFTLIYHTRSYNFVL